MPQLMVEDVEGHGPLRRLPEFSARAQMGDNPAGDQFWKSGAMKGTGIGRRLWRRMRLRLAGRSPHDEAIDLALSRLQTDVTSCYVGRSTSRRRLVE